MKKILLGMLAAFAAAPVVAQELVYEIDYDNYEKFPFYVMGYEPTIIDGVLTSENPVNEDGTPAWYQYFIADQIPTVVGETYTAVVTCKASEDMSCNLNCGWGWGEGEQKGGSLSISTEWTKSTVSYEVGGTSCNLVLQPGTSLAKIEIKNVKVYLGEAPADEDTEWVSIINNGNANEGESSNLIDRAPEKGDYEATICDNPDGEGKVFFCPIVAEPAEPWSSQFFIAFDEALEKGSKIKVSFDYYCTDERTIDTQAHGTPGAYHHWAFIGSLNAKPEWQKHKWSGIISPEQAGAEGCGSIAFNLSTKPEGATFYINNVVVELEKKISTAVETVNGAVVPVKGVYNFQGVKVADSFDEVTVPGLYITNGKKIVKK
ncbi:MAG: hypothetical protein K2J58_02640 [Muribaculaceae bacterium]|nr:hypothetical protein [Muribaculaceae bacterium]